MDRRQVGTPAGPCDGAGDMGRAGREYGRSDHTDGRVSKPPTARCRTRGDHGARSGAAPKGDGRPLPDLARHPRRTGHDDDQLQPSPGHGGPPGDRRWGIGKRRRPRPAVTDRILRALSGGFDLQHPFVDGAVTRAHRKAAGGKGARENGIGRSRGGLAGKVMAMAGAPGHPVDTVAPPGRAHDLRGYRSRWRAGLPARRSATGPSTRTGPSGAGRRR